MCLYPKLKLKLTTFYIVHHIKDWAFSGVKVPNNGVLTCALCVTGDFLKHWAPCVMYAWHYMWVDNLYCPEYIVWCILPSQMSLKLEWPCTHSTEWLPNSDTLLYLDIQFYIALPAWCTMHLMHLLHQKSLAGNRKLRKRFYSEEWLSKVRV